MAVLLPLGVNRSLVSFSEFWCEKHGLKRRIGYQLLEAYVRGEGATQHGTFTPIGRKDEHSASTLTLNPSILRMAELWSQRRGKDSQYAYQVMDRYVWDEGPKQPGTWVARGNNEEASTEGSGHGPHHREPSASGSEHQMHKTHHQGPSVSDPKHLANASNRSAPRDHSSTTHHHRSEKSSVQHLPNSKKRSASMTFLGPEEYLKKKARLDSEEDQLTSAEDHSRRLDTNLAVTNPEGISRKIRNGTYTHYNIKHTAPKSSEKTISWGDAHVSGPMRASEGMCPHSGPLAVLLEGLVAFRTQDRVPKPTAYRVELVTPEPSIVTSTTLPSATVTRPPGFQFNHPTSLATPPSASNPTSKTHEQKPETRLHFNKLATDGVLQAGDRLRIPQSPSYYGNTYSYTALNDVHAEMEYIGRAGCSQTSWRVHCPQLGINALAMTGKGPQDFRKQLETHSFEGPCASKWSNTVRFVRNGRDLGSVSEVKARRCL